MRLAGPPGKIAELLGGAMVLIRFVIEGDEIAAVFACFASARVTPRNTAMPPAASVDDCAMASAMSIGPGRSSMRSGKPASPRASWYANCGNSE